MSFQNILTPIQSLVRIDTSAVLLQSPLVAVMDAWDSFRIHATCAKHILRGQSVRLCNIDIAIFEEGAAATYSCLLHQQARLPHQHWRGWIGFCSLRVFRLL
jgi:hypothetical protein